MIVQLNYNCQTISLTKRKTMTFATRSCVTPPTRSKPYFLPTAKQLSNRQHYIHRKQVVRNVFDLDYQSIVSGITNPGPVDPVGSVNAAQAVIGLLGVSFVLTFFVAPKFKDSFKEEEQWIDIYPKLKQQGVNSITVEEAKTRRDKGMPVVDVRLARKYENGGINGSVNIPLYQPISGMGIAANVRRAGFAFFGIFGTERNPQFVQDVESQYSKNDEMIVVCETGGKMENKPGVETGFQSQSLKAVYELQKAGFKKIYHMKGGLGEWNREVEDLVLPEDMTFASKKSAVPLIGALFK
eukprot:TRINITY_DN1889_c0_g2_i3.p1 TRINITY_DN1889_c0_g2~~TRINITY_DN1889_c0_g2_i3.p1  ORF type:complete len:331 (-),score=25.49 TRINITY_DN1889_c0_g2_i3:220-1110(-)